MTPAPPVDPPSDRTPRPAEGRGRVLAGWALTVGLGAVGSMMAHGPMIASGLSRIQADVGDSRLINYLLEHNYLWYRGAPLHERFWDPPYFHPARNVAAYTDTMIGAAPPYAAFRSTGFAPDTSFQLWMMTASALNYAAMLRLLRHRLGQSGAAAAAGAFLFAFGAPRVNMVGHQQHLPHFFTVVTVDALFGLFDAPPSRAAVRGLLWLTAVGGVLAQLTSGYYLGWFLVLSLGVVAVVSLTVPATRRPFLEVLWRDAAWIVIAGVLGAVVMRPWLEHHMAADRGPRFLQFVQYYLPRPATWLHVGPRSWLEPWTARLTRFQVAHTESEQRLGVGLVTTAAALIGLWWNRQRRAVWMLATAGGAVFVGLTLFPLWLASVLSPALSSVALGLAYADRRDRPWLFLVVVGLSAASLFVVPFANGLLLGFGLAVLLTSTAALLDGGNRRPEMLALVVVVSVLTTRLFPVPSVLGIGLGLSGLVALAATVLGWRSPRGLAVLAIGGTLGFAMLMVYPWAPTVWTVAAVGVGVVAAARRARVRARVEPVLVALAFGVALSVVASDGGAVWGSIWRRVPGARAMLFVSRGGLLMLIPWGVGLGFTVDRLRARGRRAAALALGLVCLAEQGVSTSSFDKAENRRMIAALAARIDPAAPAFYYSPHDSPWPPAVPNLDAMWAGLTRGKPTLNGYSGGTPPGFATIEDPNIADPLDVLCLIDGLKEWEAEYGRPAASIQWIGGPDDPTVSAGPR